MNAHTPGKWKLKRSEHHFPGSFQITPDDKLGMTIAFVLSDIPAGEANAQLIASAPDLLAQRDELRTALQAILDIPRPRIMPHIMSEAERDMRDIARAALANAKD